MELDRPKLKEYAINKVPLFQSLQTAERSTLASHLMLREYKRGATIIHAEHPDKELMFVADGHVHVKKSGSQDKEVVLSRLGVGDFFGK